MWILFTRNLVKREPFYVARNPTHDCILSQTEKLAYINIWYTSYNKFCQALNALTRHKTRSNCIILSKTEIVLDCTYFHSRIVINLF